MAFSIRKGISTTDEAEGARFPTDSGSTPSRSGIGIITSTFAHGRLKGPNMARGGGE